MNQQAVNPYAPFSLIGDESYDAVMLTDTEMRDRLDIFAERGHEGWAGNGYDWTSIARVLVLERFPQHRDALSYDPEAGMFFMRGPREVLEEVAVELARVYDNEQDLRDLLSRAELD